jgi:hypothetical protein
MKDLLINVTEGSQVSWCTPAISARGSQRREDHELQTTLTKQQDPVPKKEEQKKPK